MATPIALSLGNYQISTLGENDVPIKTWINADFPNSVNCIGEKKQLDFQVNSSVSYDTGVKVFINMALFTAIGFVNQIQAEGTRYWSCTILPGGAIGAIYECEYTGGVFPLPAKNMRVTVTRTTATKITVSVYYFQTYDVNGYIEPGNDDNRARFLKDIHYNPNELVSDYDSVYSEVRDARAYVYVQKISLPEDNGFVECVFSGYRGIFWNTPITTGPFVFSYAQNGVPVQNLKKLSTGTDVTISFDSPVSPDRFMVSIIRTDVNEPTKNFVDNYEMDRQRVYASNPGGDKLIPPFVETNNGDGTYSYTFRVNPSELVDAGQYRFIGIAYSAGVAVGIGIGEPVDVDRYNPYAGAGLDFVGRLCDVQSEFPGNDLECVIEERMRSKLRINYFNDKFKNDIAGRLGLNIVNDIRKYLTKVEFTIYQEYVDPILGGVVRNIFDYRSGTRLNPITYTSPDMPLTFGTDFAEFQVDWRNRYEAGTDCLQTTLNGVNFLPLQDKQYWGGETMKIEWKLTFYYDDYVSPFTDEIVFEQQIRVKDYEPDIIEINSQNPADEEKEFLCNGDPLCMKAELNLAYADASEYALINNIEPTPGNVLVIEEEEAWVTEELPALFNDKINTQEMAFSETEANLAKWCVDTNKLLLNSQYKISAIAKKYIERCRRVIETGDPRITEVKEQRVTEDCL